MNLHTFGVQVHQIRLAIWVALQGLKLNPHQNRPDIDPTGGCMLQRLWGMLRGYAAPILRKVCRVCNNRMK